MGGEELPYKDRNTTQAALLPGRLAAGWSLYQQQLKGSEGCQIGSPPGKMPGSPDRRLLVSLAG